MRQKICALILLIVVFFACTTTVVQSQDDVSQLQQKIDEYTNKLNDLGKAKDTLGNQIKILNSQVELTLLKINQTESNIKMLQKDIADLSVKINELDVNLNQLSSIYINQIAQNYKLQKRTPQMYFLLSPNFNSFLEQYKYISVIQKNSQNTLVSLETNRTLLDRQKEEKRLKQQELEALEKKLADQNSNLAKQRVSKSNLLEITKNDEARYQKLRNEAQSELDSLKTAVFDGSKEVKKGDPIGIMGNTGYSFGAHLHFGLYDLTKDKLSSFEYTNDIDASGFLSKHQWPMKDYTITQGRGHTPYSYMYSDRFHHGIDMSSDTKTIYAAEDGVAYFFKDKYPNQRTGSGNHVKLFHADGHMTLYLHMEKFYK